MESKLDIEQTSMMRDMPSETPQMALKAMPAQDVGNTITESAIQPTDPLIQLLWSAIAVLAVIVTGLVIEVIISKKYSSKSVNHIS